MTPNLADSVPDRMALHGFVFCLILASMFSMSEDADANIATFAESIERCTASVGLDEVATPERCPDMHAAATALEYPLNNNLNDWPTGRQLGQLHRTMEDLTTTSPVGTMDASQNLDAILADYRFDKRKERIGMGTRFVDWLGRMLENTGIGERLQSLRHAFGMDADTRTLLQRVFTGLLILVIGLMLIVFGRTLWRYLDPNLSKQKANDQYGNPSTGADRGNLPVMTVRQINELPLSEQPPALLVAALSDMRGKELPKNVWKYTNRELLNLLAKRQNEIQRPLSVLTSVAELSLYGNRAPNQSDIDSCRQAAKDIQSLRDRQTSKSESSESGLGAVA